jgi:protein required for attachment to host cells
MHYPIERLYELVREFRHVEEEHRREPPHGPTRRRLAAEMAELTDDFERLLAEWVDDGGQRAAWREFLHGHAEAPDLSPLQPAPLFRGTTEAGATIEIRPAGTGYDLIVDGSRLDRQEVPWQLDPDMRPPIRILDHTCTETFVASPEAITALAEYVAGRGEPPWRWARELVEDGLLDPELALTSRGERCLARSRELPYQVRATCVLVADAARARVLVLDPARDALGFVRLSELVEVAEITNPTLRARNVDLLSDSRPGLRQGGRAPSQVQRHAVSDHRERHRREIERHFAARAAEEAAGVWRRYPGCDLIVVASPTMLGLLRPAISRQIRAQDRISIHELARDLTKLSAPALHDLLAEDDLLPPRGRMPRLQAIPGQPT